MNLSNADSLSTANMDFANPDYKLVFISREEVVYELGYYNNSMNLGIVGRYWDFQKDGLYGVTKKLPIEE
ncbi:hypothetical protein ACERII_05135 [Evansella sp. AB-rgal1]|uniref:hypothetical protein n=1 Tax=Evansella sp. AB-rgal1 TaxID=3242696 RepID=UPI00359DD8B8